jgi:hypothetical protein
MSPWSIRQVPAFAPLGAEKSRAEDGGAFFALEEKKKKGKRWREKRRAEGRAASRLERLAQHWEQKFF